MLSFLYLFVPLSGACALIYEIVWIRQLTLIFGGTMVSICMVTAIFMAGLAAGSYLFGRVADRSPVPWRLYAYLELGMAAGGVLVMLGVPLLQPLFIRVVASAPDSNFLRLVVGGVVAILLLALPTCCMGGTLPVLTRLINRDDQVRYFGILYGLNTLGAATGCFVAAYFLLPHLGFSLSALLAIGSNLFIGGSCLVFAHRQKIHGNLPIVPGRVDSASKGGNRGIPQSLIVLLAFCFGLAGLAYEILWTRVFQLFLGNTIYSFATVLSGYLVGLALGSGLFSLLRRRGVSAQSLLLTFLFIFILGGGVLSAWYDQLVYLFYLVHRLAGGQWWLYSFLCWLVVTAVVFLPSLASGVLLPAAVAGLNMDERHAAAGVGRILFANTAGALLGTFLAVFAVHKLVGLQGGFISLAALMLGMALLCSQFLQKSGRIATYAVSLVAVIILFLSPRWDQRLMNSGIYLVASAFQDVAEFRKTLDLMPLLAVREGSEATVAVRQLEENVRTLVINGKPDASSRDDMATQVLLAHIPALLHNGGERALVVGLGSGATLGNLSQHKHFKQLDCVEISPEVIELAPYFEQINLSPLRDKRVRVIKNDARYFLATHLNRYDLITSEPSNPWQSGNANLFTDEFYKIVKTRLKPGGVFCQWLPYYDLHPNVLNSAIKTFLVNFPNVLAFTSFGDLLLVGSLEPQSIPLPRLEKFYAMPAVGESLRSIGLNSPEQFVAYTFAETQEQLLLESRSAAINTDNNPVLEFAGRYLLGQSNRLLFANENYNLLLKSSNKRLSDLPLDFHGWTPDHIDVSKQKLRKLFNERNKTRFAELLEKS